MARLRIPPQYESGLIKIGKLREVSFRELIDLLATTPATLQHRELVEQLNNNIEALSKDDLGDILGTLVSLSRTQILTELTMPKVAEYVCEAMEESQNEELRQSAKECEDLKSRLIALLNIESVACLGKAVQVISDHDKVFISARTLSDIRPVFGTNLEDVPKGAAIIHSLTIDYQHRRRRDTFCVAMDCEDIEALIATLSRAISKAKGMKKLLLESNVSFLNPEGEDYARH